MYITQKDEDWIPEPMVGESVICVAAPAVLNAFFNATGRRIRSVPLKNHGIQLV